MEKMTHTSTNRKMVIVKPRCSLVGVAIVGITKKFDARETLCGVN